LPGFIVVIKGIFEFLVINKKSTKTFCGLFNHHTEFRHYLQASFEETQKLPQRIIQAPAVSISLAETGELSMSWKATISVVDAGAFSTGAVWSSAKAVEAVSKAVIAAMVINVFMVFTF
jgi:hypothetical protein